MKPVRLSRLRCLPVSLSAVLLLASSSARAQDAPAATPSPAPTSAPATAPTASAPTASATPQAAPAPVVQSPITSPNTDVPDAPPPPGLPQQDTLGPPGPSPQSQQFNDPNRVLPLPPLPRIGAPPAPPQVSSSTPNGPLPTPTPVAAGTPVPAVTPAPTGTPPGVEASPPAPLPLPSEGDIQSGDEEPGGDFSLEAPGGVIYDMERGLALAQGAVTFRYREFEVKGDRGLIDYNTNRATLAGNLTVTVRGQVFRGRTLVFDLDSGRWTLSSLATTFPPEFFPDGAVLEPLYVRNGTVKGDFDNLSGQDFRFSSCDRDHYYIQSRKLEFYRNRNGDPSRIVLRRNAVHVLGQRILPLPVFVISLIGANVRRQPLQATYGQNTTDGYFVRSLYNLRATPTISDSVLIDALQKRGLGLGFQRDYAATAGVLYLYALSGRQGGREINSRVDRTYQLAPGYVTNIRFDSTQNNSFAGEDVATQNGQFSFGRTGDQSQTNAIFGFNRSSYGLGGSANGSIAIDHRQDFGSGYSIQTTSLLNRAQTSDGLGGPGSDAATSDQTLTLQKQAKAFDLFLNAELHDDLVNKRSYQLERRPELTLQSSTERLALPLFGRFLPGNFSLGLGQFNEPAFDGTGQQKGRADFFFTPLGKDYRLLGQGKSQSRLSTSGNFEQAFYTDNTARYNYSYNLNSVNTVGPAQFQLNYSKQRTFGFTPFQFDFTTPGEYVDYTFSVQPSEKFRFNLSGGRDIQNSYTRDLIARAQFAPSEKLYASVGTSYRLQDDPANRDGTRFGDIYGNIRLARNRNRFGGGQLALGARYSPNGQGLTRANGSIDINLGKRTRVQGLAGYDGFTKKFDFTQFRITRDLHCFNLYATYDGQRKELRFDLAIKAFPFADTRFGRNEFSEGFDPAVGDIQ